uniref:Uncharacterized protein n=1 Tax=Acrobeloides nanus TaxID=290746 RepID=A0A914DZH9_9BILA
MKLWYLSLFVLLLIYKSFGEEGVVLNEDSEALVVEDENIKKTHTTKEAIDDIDVHHELDHKHQKHDIKKPAKTIRRTESNEEKVKLNDKKPTKSSEKVVVQEVKKVQKIKDDKTQKEEVVQEVKKVSKIKDDKTQKEEKNIKKDQPIHKENEQNPINKTEYIEQEAHWKGKKPKETIEKIPIKHGKHDSEIKMELKIALLVFLLISLISIILAVDQTDLKTDEETTLIVDKPIVPQVFVNGISQDKLPRYKRTLLEKSNAAPKSDAQEHVHKGNVEEIW